MSKRSATGKALNRRLLAYSATAGAAALGAPAASAAITVITSGTGGNLNFAGSAVTDLNPAILHFGLGASPTTQTIQAAIFSAALQGRNHGDLVTGSHSATFHAGGYVANDASGVIKLGLGDAIDGVFYQQGVFARKTVGGQFPGNFNPGTGYLGFKFIRSGNTYLGWLRAQVTIDGNGYPDSLSLVPKIGTTDVYGAYAPLSEHLTAGAVPEPSSVALTGLGLLALGAAGVREMRRRRQADGAFAS